MHAIPEHLRGLAFTTEQARQLGISERTLNGRRFVRIHRGVYRTRETEPTTRVLIQAAKLVLPNDAALSHVSNVQFRGFSIGPPSPLHFATNRNVPRQLAGIVVHRYRHRVDLEIVDGILMTPPSRTFVDVATQLNDRHLLWTGDWMVGTGLIDLDSLRDFCLTSHLDGVRRARRVAELVAERVASPRESDVRWLIHHAGLPTPEVNLDVFDTQGRWLARGDLVYRKAKVIVEYDGWQHERDAKQRQWDHLRREQLEAAGWRVIVVTAEDFKNPRHIVARIRQTLAARA